ncbi:MAG: helix-turn-helix transcriptional regulator [Victivallales bacterium]
MNGGKVIRYEHGLTQERPLSVMHILQGEERNIPMVPDTHYACHLGIVVKGCTRGRFDGNDVSLSGGDIWVTPPWQLHGTLYRKSGTELLLFNFLYDQLGFADNGINPNWESVLLRGATKPPFDRRGEVLQIASDVIAMPPGSPLTLSRRWLKLHELLLLLLEAHPESTRGGRANDFSRIYPAIELVRKRVDDYVSAEQGAAACRLGKSRFDQLFRKIMGMPYGKFVLCSKISGAAADIRNTALSLKDIAAERGFYDESHFIRVFRRRFECSPGEYRRRILKTGAVI